MLLVQAILEDGSVALEFMTDDAAEAEEMRVQMARVLLRGRGQDTGRAGVGCALITVPPILAPKSCHY
jgi:hypothetical protein